MTNKTMNNYNENNPWRGLEAYQDGEILYGRDEDIRDLSQRVITDVDTVLYGRSGIGKSSLINAGIIPSARREGFSPLSIKFVHEGNVESREKFIPYVKQIRNAIISAGVTIKEKSHFTGEKELVWELFHRNEFYDNEGHRAKLLVIFDQFEEMFTLQQQTEYKRQFFSEMADMLNDIRPNILISKEENAEAIESPQTVLSDNDDIDLDDLDISVDNISDEFVDDNGVHFIFTLREDFLSDFEYYTSTIPSLKQHRYGLRPINEEQAAEIILRPRIGLVTKDVAKLIIEKVTGRNDFKLDGIPEIEVDSAVLSLYLSRLYEERQGDTITSELVESKGGEIIMDFYNKSVEGIDDDKVKYLEDTLINEDGRRENKSERIICREVGSGVIEKLVKRKLLRRFSYASEMRIEFIHDILCPVVKQRKEQREQLILQEAEKRRLQKREIVRRIVFGVLMALVVCVCGFMWWNMKASKDRAQSEKEALANTQRQVFNILLHEDSTLMASEYAWTGNMKIIGVRVDRSKDTVVYHNNLTRDSCKTQITCTMDSIKEVKIHMEFNDKGKVVMNFDTTIEASKLKNNPTIDIEIKAKQPIPYDGKVCCNYEGKTYGVQGAIVILNGVAIKTDHDGYFKFSFTEPIDSVAQNNIVIVKKGFGILDTYLFENNKEPRDTFSLNLPSSAKKIEEKYDSLAKNRKGRIEIKTSDIKYLGKTCDIEGYANYNAKDSLDLDGSRTAVYGYYTYEEAGFGQTPNDKYIITKCTKSDEGPSISYLIEGMNPLFGKQTITWKVNKNESKKTQGKISESGVVIGEIEELEKKK